MASCGDEDDVDLKSLTRKNTWDSKDEVVEVSPKGRFFRVILM